MSRPTETGKKILLALLATALPSFIPACAAPFKSRIDNLASTKAPERLNGLVALRHLLKPGGIRGKSDRKWCGGQMCRKYDLLESGGIRDKSDRLALMRRVFRIADDSEEHPQNVMLALSLAGRYGGFAAVPVLAKKTEPSTEHWPLRQEAARGLAEFPTPESRSALIRVLERDTEPIVRQEAARSLGECGNENCLPALVGAAISNPDESVRYTACRALGKLTGLPFGANEVKWEKWWAEKRRKKK